MFCTSTTAILFQPMMDQMCGSQSMSYFKILRSAVSPKLFENITRVAGDSLHSIRRLAMFWRWSTYFARALDGRKSPLILRAKLIPRLEGIVASPIRLNQVRPSSRLCGKPLLKLESFHRSPLFPRPVRVLTAHHLDVRSVM